MAQKWITKKKGNESKHVKIETNKSVRTVEVKSIGPRAGELEKNAWKVLGDLSSTTNVDVLLTGLNKYSGLLGDYSPMNAILIRNEDPQATIVRSRDEWKYFGRTVNGDARGLTVIYPMGVPKKDGPGKIKDFIEKKRAEGIDDETIDKLAREKFNSGGDTAFAFGVGTVYDISQTQVIPGKGKPIEEDVKASQLYTAMKTLAGKHYSVSEGPIMKARGYTAHSVDGTETEIRVMKVPGENENALHTLIHEISHARLDHLKREITRSQKEKEAELSTYLVGEHFGFNFGPESTAYIKSFDQERREGDPVLGKESLDRVMNNAKWIIKQVSSEIQK